MGAWRDCEAIVHALLGQPVNSLTAMTLVGGGIVIITRSSLRWVGVASIATGVGSFLFHGPMIPLSEWIHDLTLAWLLLVVAGTGRSWSRWTHLPGLAGVALLSAIPGVATPLAVVLTVVALASILMRDRSAQTIGALVLLGVVAVVGRLGATGGPLCDPDSLWQPHGLWHVGAATALTWWAVAGNHTD